MTDDPGRQAMAAAYARAADRDRAAVAEARAVDDVRRAAILARYITVANALSPCSRERDLDYALWGLIVPGTPETGGPSLMGWRGPDDGPLPSEVRTEVAAAIRSPATAEAAWEEHHHWVERAEVHAVLGGPGLRLWVRARRAFIETRLDTLFVMLGSDPEAQATWRRLAEGPRGPEPATPPAPELPPTVPEPIRGPDAPSALPKSQEMAIPSEPEPVELDAPTEAPDPDTHVDAEGAADLDQPKRTRAEKQAAVRALLGEDLGDREIARRVGVSPSTVAAVRKAAA